MRVGVITSYPDGDIRKSGIAEYARALLEPLAGCQDDIVVYADHPAGTSFFAKDRIERIAPNLTVVRCWRFGALAPIMLLKTLLRDRSDVLHVEYDVYLYGGVVAALLLPIALKLISFRRKVLITTTLHGVVPLNAISREMLRENGFVLPFSRIGKVGFRLIYGLFKVASHRYIALESQLSKVLCEDYGYAKERTFTVPCPNLMAQNIASTVSRRVPQNTRRTKRLLYFGYASSYKGLFILLDAFEIARRQDPEIQLDLVAGRHPRLAGQPKYEDFYDRLLKRSAEVGARHHDFMQESELAKSLSLCDAVVLPYTKMYGGSGPLNIAVAARKPLLVSRVMYFEGARPGQVFEPNAESCAATIVRFFGENRSEIESNLEMLAASRNNTTIAAVNHKIRCGADPLALPNMATPNRSNNALRT